MNMTDLIPEDPEDFSIDERPLNEHVSLCISQLLMGLEDSPPENLYQLCMEQVEPALITAVLKHVDGNQTQAAKILGINRNTLRKKCLQYQLV